MPAGYAANVYGFKTTNTGTGKMEVHVLDRSTDYKTFSLQTGTALDEADAAQNFVFGAADYDRDFNTDVYCLKRTNTGTGKLEVHILNGGASYDSFLLQIPTPIDAADAAQNFVFALADFNNDGIPDLYCIKRANTSSGRMEVHVLNGADAYQSFLAQSDSALSLADATANFKFAVADYNNDGHPDIYCLKTRNTGSGSLEVHVLDGGNNYQSFLLHTGTPITAADADSNFEFAAGDYAANNNYDLFCLKKTNTGLPTMEVHVLSRADNFQSFLLQSGSALDAKDAAQNFKLGVGYVALPGVQGGPGF